MKMDLMSDLLMQLREEISGAFSEIKSSIRNQQTETCLLLDTPVATSTAHLPVKDTRQC